MEVGEVGAVCRLENVSLEVHILNLFYLQHLFLVHLLQSVAFALQIHKFNDSIAATAKVPHPLEIFHG